MYPPIFTFFIKPVSAAVDCYHDYVAPVAICDAHTIVALNNLGEAKLYATDLDDGSYDNCGIVEYKVRRMNPGWCPYGYQDDTQFRPYVQFCCEDVGNTLWVVLRVVDGHGNYNECMAEVTVQDNSSPHLICPPNITVSCSFWFGPDALNNPYNHTFGTVAVNGAPRLPIIINDPGNSWNQQPYNWGIDGTTGGSVCNGNGGNVWVTIPEVIDYRNACGVGVIKRKFYVETGWWSDWCYQTITVKDYSNNYFNIDWPEDYHIDGCQYGPEDVDPDELPPPYNRPTWNGWNDFGSGCSLIGYAHEDLVFTFSEGACYKILRTWTVIDWCKYQANNPYTQGIWTHVQVIKLFNHNPPQFVYGCQDVVVDGYEPYCSGRFFQQPHVEDDCTPTELLKWDYKIDKWNDGSYDISYAGTGQPTVDIVLPDGWHKILWNVSDACGNYTTCSYKVHVHDKKAPTPVCYYGLSTVVMPLGGMVTIWAKDFNASSSDNCTPPYKLRYSFSSNPLEASRTFTCDDLGTNAVQIWVFDEYGNSDYCTTFIKINDNEDACVGMNTVQGLVTTTDEEPLPNVGASMFKVMPDQSLEDDESEGMSNVHGQFKLGFGTTQYDRMVELQKVSKPLEGITTADVITLQRHISGEEIITDPYKLYAADLDGNGHVGANDLSLLRKALLGGYKLPGYAGNLQWIFFGDPCNPDSPEDLFTPDFCHSGVQVDHSATFPMNIRFKALKMGDVNGDHAGAAWSSTPRTSNGFTLYVRENKSNHNFEVLSSHDASIYGLQFSVDGQFASLEGGTLPLDDSNIAADQDGYSRISWGQSTPIEVKANEVLFTIGQLQEGKTLEDVLMTNDEGLVPEIYVEGVENQKIELRAFYDPAAPVTYDANVTPNPFTDNTKLQINIPAGTEFLVYVYDVKGQELFKRKYLSTDNQSDVVFGPELIRSSGMYYYRVSSDLGEISGKFIKQ